MNTTKPKSFSDHNDVQVTYYSRAIKPRMVPGPTPYVLRQIDQFVAATGLKKSDSIIEIGAGMGRYTLNLAEQGYNVEALDLTPYLLERLNEYNGGRFEIPMHCVDLLDHPQSLNGRFDAAIGFFTLHHLHDLKASYRAMAEMVKPGGFIAFLEPNAFNPLYYIQIAATPGMTWEGDKGVAQMRKGLIYEAMEHAGLVDCSLKRFGFFPSFITNRPGGTTLESAFEAFPLWKPLLPFQIFIARKPR